MLRLVTDFVEIPSFLLLCDQPNCGIYQAANVPAGLTFDQAQAGFLKVVIDAGWAVGIGRQLCKGHAQQLVEQHKLVQVANGAMAKAFRN